VTLLGIPFGSQTGRKGAFLGVALSIGLFFGYYVLVNVGLGVAKSMLVPPWWAAGSPISSSSPLASSWFIACVEPTRFDELQRCAILPQQQQGNAYGVYSIG
jgi:hypothetical protein